MRVEGWPVHRLIACAARPGGVPATVTETSLMPHQHLSRPESVAVRASGRRVGDPLPAAVLHEFAQYGFEAIRVVAARGAARHP
jgi:hypothetical protein